MFLAPTIERNPELIQFALHAHRRGALLPDTYVLDLDSLLENAAHIGAAARQAGLSLYFMLKQMGRIGAAARRLHETGLFRGAVAVDYKETLFYLEQGIPVGHAGHLVQLPEAVLPAVLDARPEVITVYSAEKAERIGALAVERGFTQDIMLRVVGEDDLLYSGQTAGVDLSRLDEVAARLRGMRGVNLAGVCAFPCLLYNAREARFEPTPNARTVTEAAAYLRGAGFEIRQVNMPSATCAASMPVLAALGATHGEPGHGLLGSTPFHVTGGPERPAMVYLSEVSHQFRGKSYCYGGGYYRRGHLHAALVGGDPETAVRTRAIPPDNDSIDYHLGLDGRFAVGSGVVMAFRTQVFVTRSSVALVEGLRTGSPRIVGRFDALGRELG